MTDQQFQNFQAFMNRVQLTGAEVPAWVEVVNAVGAMRQKAAGVPTSAAPEPEGVAA